MNLAEVDQLAETNSPVKTTFTFEPTHNQLTEIVDPLQHPTSFTYNSDGTLATTTLIGNTFHFGYSGGDLVSILDPANNQITRFLDSGGRLLAVTDPVGHKTQYQYNNLNQVTQITDPVGNLTGLMYDANGNLLSVTDALPHTTSYTYDNMDQLSTRKDPLLRQETYLYDSGGNLVSFTDRKGQVTTYTYDGLNRATSRALAQWSTEERPPTPALSIISTMPAAALTQAADSTSGTITRMFDGLDRLTLRDNALGQHFVPIRCRQPPQYHAGGGAIAGAVHLR